MFFLCRKIFPVKKLCFLWRKMIRQEKYWVSVSDLKGLGLRRCGLGLEWPGLGLGLGLGWWGLGLDLGLGWWGRDSITEIHVNTIHACNLCNKSLKSQIKNKHIFSKLVNYEIYTHENNHKFFRAHFNLMMQMMPPYDRKLISPVSI